MNTRIALAAALLAVYAGSLRLTGQGLQGGPSAARNWAQDAPMKISEPFTLASVGDVIIVRRIASGMESDL